MTEVGVVVAEDTIRAPLVPMGMALRSMLAVTMVLLFRALIAPFVRVPFGRGVPLTRLDRSSRFSRSRAACCNFSSLMADISSSFCVSTEDRESISARRALLLLVTWWLGLAAEEYGCWLLVVVVLLVEEEEEEVQEEAFPSLAVTTALAAALALVVALVLLVVTTATADLLLVDEVSDCDCGEFGEFFWC